MACFHEMVNRWRSQYFICVVPLSVAGCLPRFCAVRNIRGVSLSSRVPNLYVFSSAMIGGAAN